MKLKTLESLQKKIRNKWKKKEEGRNTNLDSDEEVLFQK
jgi:hypothetical protein